MIQLSELKRLSRLYTDPHPHIFERSEDKRKQRIYVDVPDEEAYTPLHVVEALANVGYESINYKQGLAKQIGGHRVMRYSKLLTKKVMNSVLHDPVRQGKNNGKLQIVISRSPVDIAKMSDHGEHWVTCMSPGKEEFPKIGEDIKSGSLIVYLISSDDPKIKRPLARAMLIVAKNNKGNGILCIDRVYGNNQSQFLSIVQKFVNWANSGSASGLYTPPKKVYSDKLGITVFVNPDHSDPSKRSLNFSRIAWAAVQTYVMCADSFVKEDLLKAINRLGTIPYYLTKRKQYTYEHANFLIENLPAKFNDMLLTQKGYSSIKVQHLKLNRSVVAFADNMESAKVILNKGGRLTGATSSELAVELLEKYGHRMKSDSICALLNSIENGFIGQYDSIAVSFAMFYKKYLPISDEALLLKLTQVAKNKSNYEEIAATRLPTATCPKLREFLLEYATIASGEPDVILRLSRTNSLQSHHVYQYINSGKLRKDAVKICLDFAKVYNLTNLSVPSVML